MNDCDNGQSHDNKNGGASAPTTTNNTMVVPVGADTRNMAWRKSNVGSKLLSKMGWSDGQAVGKRQRRSTQVVTAVSSHSDANNQNEEEEGTTSTTTTTINSVSSNYFPCSSSEGLRVMKRQDGLGIGATAASSAYSNASNAVQHVQDYVNVLALLQQQQQ